MTIRTVADPSPYARRVAEVISGRQGSFTDALNRLQNEREQLGEIAARMLTTLAGDGRVLVAGNGGSAAEAQHFAAELVGRFKRERDPYAAIALTADTSILTAIGNDYGFAEVFARQVGGLGRPGDIFVAFSTSGTSENLVRAAEAAHKRNMTVVSITCDRPNRLAEIADLPLRIPSTDTPVTQELHMIVTHILCDIVEAELSRTHGRMRVVT